MEQPSQVSQDNLWFGRREPFVQIKILKFLSQNMYASKIELANETGTDLSNIENMVKDMIMPKNSKNSLIQEFGIKKIERKRSQKVYTLTRYGMEVLLKNHWKDSKNNKKLGIENKPYLNTEELINWFNNYCELYSYAKHKSKYTEFKIKNIKIELNENYKLPIFSNPSEPIHIYCSANPELENEIEIHLAKSIFEDDKKNQEKLKKLERIKKTIEKAKREREEINKSLKNSVWSRLEKLGEKLNEITSPDDIKMASDYALIMKD